MPKGDFTTVGRHKLTQQDSPRGGKARASQLDFVEACRQGFAATKEAHPYFARHVLSRKIEPDNQARKNKRKH